MHSSPAVSALLVVAIGAAFGGYLGGDRHYQPTDHRRTAATAPQRPLPMAPAAAYRAPAEGTREPDRTGSRIDRCDGGDGVGGQDHPRADSSVAASIRGGTLSVVPAQRSRQSTSARARVGRQDLGSSAQASRSAVGRPPQRTKAQVRRIG